MTLVRRLLLVCAAVALPLALAVTDPSAARARPRHRIARVTTAVYHVAARPHIARRMQADHLANRRFALDHSPPAGCWLDQALASITVSKAVSTDAGGGGQPGTMMSTGKVPSIPPWTA
jgi:hypothetical protein